MEQISVFGERTENHKAADKLKLIIKRMKELKEEIKYHNDLYYNQDAPKTSDYEYDKLTQELKKLEKEYPELIEKDSPTQLVGGVIKNTFTKVIHEVKMQSLNDVFSFDEIREFVQKLQEEYGEIEFVVETKIDGLSVSLEYEHGELKRGSTRGDGVQGEDVTQNLLTLQDIPKHLTTDDTVEFRGEVYMSHLQFQKINNELIAQNKDIMANPRNAAAGTLRQLNPELVKQRGLNIFVFNIQKSQVLFETHSESLEYAKKCGVATIEYSKKAKNIEEILKYINEIGSLRKDLPYDIDGAVVKVNNLNLRQLIGVTTKVPRWAVAYKYPPVEQLTKVEDILIQVGRTGQVTPLAKVSPILVAGSVISKCTLHNFDYIKEKDIRIGDYVWIRKAGDVIPEVVKVEITKREDDLKKYFEPKYCPVCGDKLEKDTEQVALRCLNSECEAQIYRMVLHFVSRDCMNIERFRYKSCRTIVGIRIYKRCC